MTADKVLHKYFHHFKSERTRDVVIRAMEEYASQQRTEGIREGFEAARDGLKVSKVNIEIIDGDGTNMVTELTFTYPTADDYLNSKR